MDVDHRSPVPAVLAVVTTALVVLAGCTAADRRTLDGIEAASRGAPPPEPAAIDQADWTRYTSEQYGIEVGHPPDWTVIPATRSWESADARDPLSPALDTFVSPSGDVRVSVWQVPLDAGSGMESSGDVAAWVEEHCAASGEAPCTGIGDRAVDLCLEKWDCHPGLLVPFTAAVQAFFSGGIYDAGAMTVVSVWHGHAPEVARHGGSQRLLETFLSTMAVWPASTPRDERTCYGRPPVGLDCSGT